MNIVLFEPSEIDRPLPLKDERSVHILNVLHKTQGETFESGIIGSQAGKSEITSIDENGIHFIFHAESDGKLLYPLSMIIGFPRPIQLRRLFRDVAGLGCCKIHLTGTELGEKSYMQSDIVSNAYNLLKEGSIQAKSTHVPRIELHKNLFECLNCIHGDFLPENTLFIALDNIRSSISLSDFLKQKSYKNVVAAIGSERGWTDSERNQLEQNGFVLCSMGTRVLRTETAATVAASIILSEMGVLK